MSALAALLVVNAVVHGLVVARFGIRQDNEPFFLFALVYAALAIAVFSAVPYALWAVLLLSLIGLIGLSVTFHKPVRGKSLDKLIWLLDVATILSAGFLLAAGHSA
jgi:hypothetical protein